MAILLECVGQKETNWFDVLWKVRWITWLAWNEQRATGAPDPFPKLLLKVLVQGFSIPDQLDRTSPSLRLCKHPPTDTAVAAIVVETGRLSTVVALLNGAETTLI